MVNVVDWHVHLNDAKRIMAIDVKVKAIDENPTNIGTRLLAAFANTTLLDDIGTNVSLSRNEERNGTIADLKIRIKKDSPIKLSNEDAAKFVDALQRELDRHETNPFP